jgi:hypothetical protein
MSDPDRSSVLAPPASAPNDRERVLSVECRTARQTIANILGPPMKHLPGGLAGAIEFVQAFAPSYVGVAFGQMLTALDQWERDEREALASQEAPQ